LGGGAGETGGAAAASAIAGAIAAAIAGAEGEVSLYMHVPFCVSFCDYCDFYSEKADSGRMDFFTRRLLADIEWQLAFFNVKKIPSAYIGGGTPSVLGARRMGDFLAGLQGLFAAAGIPSPAEFTVEANPESLSEGFLQACTGGGVTRLSLGLQTFHEPSRRAVNRGGGGAARLKDALSLAGSFFPGNFSIDLMSALPFQTHGILRDDIERALAASPSGLSLYSLTLEPDSPLARNLGRTIAWEDFPQGEAAENLWLAGRDALRGAGYEHYEVSNFALAGKRCLHNVRYWRMESWIGAGPAASGTFICESGGKVAARRYTYKADLQAYLAAPAPSLQSAFVEELDTLDLIKDTLLMGYRFCEGPDPHLFRRRFSRDIEECIPKTIARWKDRSMFNSEKMLPLLDVFLREAFAELDEDVISD